MIDRDPEPTGAQRGALDELALVHASLAVDQVDDGRLVVTVWDDYRPAHGRVGRWVTCVVTVERDGSLTAADTGMIGRCT
jgi:hypothetical protein